MTLLVLVLLAAPVNAPLALATIAALGHPPKEEWLRFLPRLGKSGR